MSRGGVRGTRSGRRRGNKTLDAGGVVVGDDVEITLKLEFNRPA